MSNGAEIHPKRVTAISGWVPDTLTLNDGLSLAYLSLTGQSSAITESFHDYHFTIIIPPSLPGHSQLLANLHNY
jgi:hypothetical protein